MNRYTFLTTSFSVTPTNSTLNFVFFIRDNAQSRNEIVNTCKQQWRNLCEAYSRHLKIFSIKDMLNALLLTLKIESQISLLIFIFKNLEN